MCGIAGLIKNNSENYIEKMTNTLIHRGPDEYGFYHDGIVSLGHRRLSIRDIANGHQPMIDAITGMSIVYNGEIYNNLELRHDLEQNGYKFKTRCDTETVLQAFIQWGTEAFIRFNGMFALAIYDPKRKKIWLARDRFGEKPLFYFKQNDIFAFASEISAFYTISEFNTSFEQSMIQNFMAWNYLTGTKTLHKNCYKLLPGTWLSYDLENKEINTYRYWEFNLTPDYSITEKKESELIEELQHLIIQSVKRRLVSDVPLGIFLSGGLDSSTILAAATKILPPENITAFTIGFTEDSFDETPFANQIANFFVI